MKQIIKKIRCFLIGHDWEVVRSVPKKLIDTGVYPPITYGQEIVFVDNGVDYEDRVCICCSEVDCEILSAISRYRFKKWEAQERRDIAEKLYSEHNKRFTPLKV